MANNLHPLPPGQRGRANFPRFGLIPLATRFPKDHSRRLAVVGAVKTPLEVADVFEGLARVEQTSDFHCVTTWSYPDLRWGGVRFADFYEHVVAPRAQPSASATLVALRSQDGARTALLLEDLLSPDVLLADSLNGELLTVEHGAPLRLVAPRHYGYKSIKYLSRIEFRRPEDGYAYTGFQFMDHLRARVDLEERGRGAPGWLLRYLYRPLITPTVKTFAKASAAHALKKDIQTQRRG